MEMEYKVQGASSFHFQLDQYVTPQTPRTCRSPQQPNFSDTAIPCALLSKSNTTVPIIICKHPRAAWCILHPKTHIISHHKSTFINEMNYEITNSASELGSIGKVEASHTCHLEFSPISQLTHAELAIEKKLRRKIDLLIMPLMILTYLMNYIDR